MALFPGSGSGVLPQSPASGASGVQSHGEIARRRHASVDRSSHEEASDDAPFHGTPLPSRRDSRRQPHSRALPVQKNRRVRAWAVLTTGGANYAEPSAVPPRHPGAATTKDERRAPPCRTGKKEGPPSARVRAYTVAVPSIADLFVAGGRHRNCTDTGAACRSGSSSRLSGSGSSNVVSLREIGFGGEQEGGCRPCRQPPSV